MTDIPAQFKFGTTPQVNLVPPEVGEKRQRSRQRGVALFSLVVFLVVVAAVYFFVWTLQQSAAAAAAEETARTEQLQAQIAEFSEVDVVKAQLANAESARQSAAAVELFWPLMMGALRAGMPAEADVDLYTFVMPSYGQTPAAPSSLFGRSPIGVVSFTARITSPGVASSIEDQLNTIPFFERARVISIRPDDSASGEGAAPVEGGAPPTAWIVDGTVDVNYDVLMMRYSPFWFGQPATDTTPEIESLEEYYVEYFEMLLAGEGTPPGYPPLPAATIPPFIPGQSGVVAPAPGPTPAPSPTPTAEVAS